jgi:hypothetical protein
LRRHGLVRQFGFELLDHALPKVCRQGGYGDLTEVK